MLYKRVHISQLFCTCCILVCTYKSVILYTLYVGVYTSVRYFVHVVQACAFCICCILACTQQSSTFYMLYICTYYSAILCMMYRRVHISQRTLDHLHGEYDVEAAEGWERHPALKQAGLPTYFIVANHPRKVGNPGQHLTHYH